MKNSRRALWLSTFAGLPRPNLKPQGNDFNSRAVFVRRCAGRRTMRQQHVHSVQTAWVAPRTLCLPQVQKRCSNFLWRLVSTLRPLKKMHGLLFKNVPATGAKTVQGFLLNTCGYHTSISNTAGVAFRNCACHRSKNRVSCEFFGAHYASPFKGMQRLLLKHCACHRPSSKSAGVSPDNVRPPRVLRLCQCSRHLRRRLCAKCLQFFEKEGRINIPFLRRRQWSADGQFKHGVFISVLHYSCHFLEAWKIRIPIPSKHFSWPATWQHRSWSCIFFPKKEQRFLATTCVYHYLTSIVKSARAASQNCICHSAKTVQGFLANTCGFQASGFFSNTAPGTAPKRLQEFSLTPAPAIRPFQRVQGLILKTVQGKYQQEIRTVTTWELSNYFADKLGPPLNKKEWST